MKVLILGGTGMLGFALTRRLAATHPVTVTVRRDAASYQRLFASLGVRAIGDVEIASGFAAVRQAIALADCDVIVNCIGIVKQSHLATDHTLLHRINAELPQALAEISEQRGMHIIHISTDCVFSGRHGNYSETYPPDPEDLYGKTKLAGEVSTPRFTVLRTSFIGPELYHKLGLLEWLIARRGHTVRGFSKSIFSGVTTREMGVIIETVISQPSNLGGIWHVAGPSISKLALLKLLNDALHLGVRIVEDDSVVIDRSLNGSAFERKSGYRAPSWQDMVSELSNDVLYTHSLLHPEIEH